MARSGFPLFVLALASATIFLAALGRPLWLGGFYDWPHQDIPKLMGVTNHSALWFASTAAGVFILYLVALLLARRLHSGRHGKTVLALSALFSLSLLPMFPGGAGDVYAYIAEADLVLRYHSNPFLTPVAAFPYHPLLPFIDFPNETTHYGPLWALIGVGLRALSGGGLLEGLLAFKAAAALFLIATAWLVYLTLKRTRPEQAVSGALLVAWNPFLLFETAGNAHNDIAMMVFVALAFYLRERRRPWMAISALIAAALVKYIAAALLPLFVISLLRSRFLEAQETATAGGALARPSVADRGRERGHLARAGETPALPAITRAGDGTPTETAALVRTLIAGSVPKAVLYLLGLVGLGAVLVATVGFKGTVGVMLNQSAWFTTSPQAVAYLWLSQAVPTSHPGEMVSRIGQALFGLVFILEARRVWIQPGALAECSMRVVLALLLVGLSWFEPWYVTWAIPIGAIAGTRTARGAAIALGAGAFATHSIMGFGWRLDWHQGNLPLIHAAGAAAVWLPTLTGMLLASLRHSKPQEVDRPASAQLSLHE